MTRRNPLPSSTLDALRAGRPEPVGRPESLPAEPDGADGPRLAVPRRPQTSQKASIGEDADVVEASVRVNLTVPGVVYEQLRARAFRDRVTVPELIRQALTEQYS